jgi:hypothetical protein
MGTTEEVYTRTAAGNGVVNTCLRHRYWVLVEFVGFAEVMVGNGFTVGHAFEVELNRRLVHWLRAYPDIRIQQTTRYD